jgi:hypothetical protein
MNKIITKGGKGKKTRKKKEKNLEYKRERQGDGLRWARHATFRSCSSRISYREGRGKGGEQRTNSKERKKTWYG